MIKRKAAFGTRDKVAKEEKRMFKTYILFIYWAITTKKREGNNKGIEVEGETPYPRAIDALIDEEQRGKKKETGSVLLTQLPWAIRSLPSTHRDYTVCLSF